jgi:hypothetical protein
LLDEDGRCFCIFDFGPTYEHCGRYWPVLLICRLGKLLTIFKGRAVSIRASRRYPPAADQHGGDQNLGDPWVNFREMPIQSATTDKPGQWFGDSYLLEVTYRSNPDTVGSRIRGE